MNERGTWSRRHIKNVKSESKEMPPHRTDVHSKREQKEEGVEGKKLKKAKSSALQRRRQYKLFIRNDFFSSL